MSQTEESSVPSTPKIEQLKSISETILPILTTLVPVLGGVCYFFNYFYSKKSEVFYGIPSKYTLTNILDMIDNLVFVSLLAVFYIFLFFGPFFIKKALKRDELRIFLSVFYSFLLGFLSSFFLILSIRVYISLNVQLFVTCFIISFLSYLCVFFANFNDNESIEGFYNRVKRYFLTPYMYIPFIILYIFLLLTSPVYSIPITIIAIVSMFIVKKNWLRIKTCSFAKIFTYIYTVLALLFMLSLLALLSEILVLSPENKKNYEIVSTEDGDQAAVITVYDGKSVLMPCDIDYSNNTLTLHKGSYFLKDIEEYPFKYHTFSKVNCIEISEKE